MSIMKTYNNILTSLKTKRALFALLVDPDEIEINDIANLTAGIISGGVDILLFGGSLISRPFFNEKISAIKKQLLNIPVILFPGSHNQISKQADAILFLSLLSGRNPDYLIGNHIMAAPAIRAMQLEAISTAYLLIESGTTTTVEFVSNTKPIPSAKPDLTVAHALAAEYLGFKTIYLEAGSGADQSVPESIIRAVKSAVSIPVIVGGGIRTPQAAGSIARAGADIVVIGNHFQTKDNLSTIRDFRKAINDI